MVVAWSVSERCIALTLRTRLLIYRLLKTQSGIQCGLNATRAQNLPLTGIRKLAQALIDWDATVLRLQVATQEPSDFNKKLGLEKTFSLCQAADELKRYMARLN